MPVRICIAERTHGFPDCPNGNLVNRRNSASASRIQAYANDCYILNMLMNDTRSKEINHVVSAACIVLDETSRQQCMGDDDVASTEDHFSSSDISAILVLVHLRSKCRSF